MLKAPSDSNHNTKQHKNATTYPYWPLTPNSGFRILILHPSSDIEADICGQLIPAQINDHPPYEALSYTWGLPETSVSIDLDGHSFGITSNLDVALRHLRYTDKPRYLWVDALCIDQSNLEERSSHVGYMKEVYAHCEGDVLWIGHDETILNDGLKAMNYWGDLMKMNDRMWSTYLNDDDEIREQGEKQIEAIEGLFAKPSVWQRVWIMQEISFAPSVILMAGHATMSWDQVEQFLTADTYIKMYGIPGAFHGPFSHETSIRTIANGALAYPQILAHQRRVIRTGAKGYGSTLLDVLARFKYTKSTNPRDKIYALLGLCSDDADIKVDYHRSVRDVYTDCMKTIMERNGHLDFLCQAPWELYSNKERNPDLPSWVCDFASPGNAEILFAQRNIFNAGGDDIELPLPVSPEGILGLHGFSLGFFESIRGEHDRGSSPPYPPFSKRALSSMPDALIQEGIDAGNPTLAGFLRNEPEPAHIPISSATSFQDYYKTLVMDCRRGPMRRLDNASAEELDTNFQEWLSKPLDSTRDMDLDFKIQEFVFPYWKWNFSISDQGLYCMAPPGAEAGDEIVVLKGAKVPVVLRAIKEQENFKSGTYQFIGSCYVHGFMDGRVFELDDRESRSRLYEIA